MNSMSHLFKLDYSIYSETVKRDYFLLSTLEYSVLSLTGVRETRELLPYATYFKALTTNTGGFLILKFLVNFLWFTPLFTFFYLFTYFRQRFCLWEMCFMRTNFWSFDKEIGYCLVYPVPLEDVRFTEISWY